MTNLLVRFSLLVQAVFLEMGALQALTFSLTSLQQVC